MTQTTGSPRPPRVALTGLGGFVNKGCAAMVEATMSALGRALPGARFVMLSPVPELDGNRYDGVEVVKSVRRDVVRGPVMLARAAVWAVLKRLVGWDVSALRAHPELRALAGSDMVVDLTGDVFTDVHPLRAQVSFLIPLVAGLCLGKPTTLYAQTLGPFNGYMRLLFRPILRRCALVLPRDEPSLEHVQALGIEEGKVHLTADSAFLLQPAHRRALARVLQRGAASDLQPPVVGACLSPGVARLFERHNSAGRQTYVRFMADLMDHVAGRYGASILFFPHVFWPGHRLDDAPVIRAVRECMSQRDRTALLDDSYEPSVLKAIAAECEVLIANRMHAAIAGAGACVPTMCLSYHWKFRANLSPLGLAPYVLDPRTMTAEEIRKTFERLWTHRHEIRRELQDRLPAVQALSFKSAELVRDLWAAQHPARNGSGATHEDA